jgi:hypothetical protein
MGCHTWYSVPYKTDKSEIINAAQKWLNEAKHISIGHKKIYQYAIDNEIIEPVLELASFEFDCTDRDNTKWILYKDANNYFVEKYNKENGTNIENHDYNNISKLGIERYGDEPRIGGYPEEVIIHSYDEMLEFIKKGYTDQEGKHHDFYYNKDREHEIMSNIKMFFANNPEGIITFG